MAPWGGPLPVSGRSRGLGAGPGGLRSALRGWGGRRDTALLLSPLSPTGACAVAGRGAGMRRRTGWMESQASQLQVQTDNDVTAWRRKEPVRSGESCEPRRSRPRHVMAPGRRRRGGKRAGRRGGALASAACGDPLVGMRLEVGLGSGLPRRWPCADKCPLPVSGRGEDRISWWA